MHIDTPHALLWLLLAAPAVQPSAPAAPQQPRWRIDDKPIVVIGAPGSDPSDALAIVTGATRLADGNILVGDRNDPAMLIFSPNGKRVKAFGRKGHGPGEVTFSAWMMRCGDHAFVSDLDGNKISVFSLAGQFERVFVLDQKTSGDIPYRSACNRNGRFVHYGWDSDKEMRPTAFRTTVALWTSPADSLAGRLFGRVLGSERWATRPLPLGRETRVAIGKDRVYVGEGESYTIKVFAMDGAPLPAITKSVKPVSITQADVDNEMEREISTAGEKWRKSTTRDYAGITMPRTFPPYSALLVDANENLWVQDYAPSSPGKVTWTVFDPHGKQLAELQLPATLEVYEIGNDYVLGRYLDREEAVPEVRMYRLQRGSR